MSESRIYKVTQKTGENTTEVRLVRSANRIQAENFVANDTIEAEVATQDDLIHLAVSGVKVEDAKTE